MPVFTEDSLSPLIVGLFMTDGIVLPVMGKDIFVSKQDILSPLSK